MMMMTGHEEEEEEEELEQSKFSMLKISLEKLQCKGVAKTDD